MRHLQVLVEAEILLLKLAMVAVAMLTTSSVYADLPTIVALDNADFSQYAPQPNNNWLRTNGGSGYQPWTWITDPVGPLHTYMEGAGVNNQQVEGNYSFGLSIGSIWRPLAAPITGAGEFDVLTRFVASPTNS